VGKEHDWHDMKVDFYKYRCLALNGNKIKCYISRMKADIKLNADTLSG
jgi:hypothetical protein